MSDIDNEMLYSENNVFKRYKWSKVMEKSNLVRLKHEVLDHGPEAALPMNLPDEWVRLLARDLEMLQEISGKDSDDHNYLSAPLAIIAHILYARRGNDESEISFSNEDLYNFLNDLRVEIALEGIRRWTDASPEPATLETIFTNREVTMG